MIAALFVEAGGTYYGDPELDPWDQFRDARAYPGPHRVIAHPPCARWCKFAKQIAGRLPHNPARQVGADEGCFASAMASVERWGGVLEHPAYTLAWPAFELTRPVQGRWIPSREGWVTQVSQCAYGHRARKLTWLYVVAASEPPAIDWSSPEPEAVIQTYSARGKRPRTVLTARENLATPPAFKALLKTLALGDHAR